MFIQLHPLIFLTNNPDCTNKNFHNKDKPNANNVLTIIMSANHFFYVCEVETPDALLINPASKVML